MFDCHGFCSAFLPKNMLPKKFARKMSCENPRMNADHVMNSFHGANWFRNSYFVGSAMRRMWPPSPRMCIGKKTALNATNVRSQWTKASLLFIIRPNIFGNQKYSPPKIEKIVPPNTM